MLPKTAHLSQCRRSKSTRIIARCEEQTESAGKGIHYHELRLNHRPSSPDPVDNGVPRIVWEQTNKAESSEIASCCLGTALVQ